MKSKRLMLLAVFATVLLVFAAGCGETVEPEEVEAPEEPEEEEPDEEEPLHEVFEVGSRIEIDVFAITINEVTADFGSDWEEPDEDHVFLLVDITTENITDEAENISSMLNFDLVDADGYSLDQTIYTEAKGDMDGEIGAGRKKRGQIVWEIPVDAEGLELIYDPLFKKGQAIWELGEAQDYIE